MPKSKWRSPTLWIGIVATILAAVSPADIAEVCNITLGWTESALRLALACVGALAVVNNPEVPNRI